MSEHGIISAKYARPVPFGGYAHDAEVVAIRFGREESRRANDDIEGGGMLAYLAEGGVIDPYVPPVPTESDYAAAIQSFVDETAKAKGYANGVALSGYVASSVDAWASEAATFIAWRDAVWLHAYSELAKVQNGQRPQPTIPVFIGELPPPVWLP